MGAIAAYCFHSCSWGSCHPRSWGSLGGLGGGASIGRLVLLHLLDHRIFWQVHFQVAEIKAGRNDIHVRHVPPSAPPIAQDLLQ